MPPAPIRRRFPGVALLLGLQDDETPTDKTPWWLLLLRMLAVAAMILGFAGPVLNPKDDSAGSGPLLIAIDGTWADASDWIRRIERVEALLGDARANGRPVAVAQLTDLPAGPLQFQAADGWASRLAGLSPRPWAPDPLELESWVAGFDTGFDTYWLSDGLARPGRAEVLAAFEAQGSVTVFESPRSVLGLRPAAFEDGAVVLSASRSRGAGA